MECKYCNSIRKNKNSLVNHERLCKENPNKSTLVSNFIKYNEKRKELNIKGTNQFIKARNNGNEIKVSSETREKLSKSIKGKKYTEEQRHKISEYMKKVIREKPESYSASNINGRVKKVTYNGVILDSKWEYEFAKWCDVHNIIWEKNKTSFEYDWNGKRLYYPDFYLKDLKYYVEIKGYERDRDKEKWKAVPNLLVIKKYEIEKIRDGSFSLSQVSPHAYTM